jgi:small conductance mechanosensitive channel
MSLAVWGSDASWAQEPAKAPAPQPITIGDPAIAVDQLEVQLTPLTKAELEVETNAWLGLVRAKAGEISKAELAVKQDKVEGGAEGKTRLLAQINKLRDERTQLIDRTRAVLASLTAKGGNAADPEKYLVAVSGLKVDVKDANAAVSALLGWIQSPQGGLRWLKNVAFFIVTLIVFRILSSIVGHAVKRALSLAKSGSGLLQDFLVNSIRKLVMLVGAVVALSMLEVNVGPLVAAIGAVGFVVGFALQGTLGNFAAGVMILLYRPYDLGDTVTVAGTTGKVDSMTLVSTTIHTPDNKRVVVPNSSIWGSAIQKHLA